MVTRKRVAAVLACLAVLAVAWRIGSGWRSEEPYTALVVDTQTGKSVAGAIVLAIWWKEVWGRKVWFEGPSTVMNRYWEGTTGADGRVVVPGFWRRLIFGEAPSLSVYKPGYTLWNRTWIFPGYAQRTDFDREHRTVRLEPWQPQFSSTDHRGFIENSVGWCYSEEPYLGGKKLFYQEVDQHEEPLGGRGQAK